MVKRSFLAVVAAAVLSAPAAHAWTWPVNGPVLRPFSFGANPYLGGQHRGIDVGGPPGASVRAPAGGAVTFAGSVPSGGKSLTIQTGDGYSVTLVHLGSIDVPRGSSVTDGAPVGTVGPSGDPEIDGPYVHLGVRVSSDPQGYLDPLAFLPPRGTVFIPAAAPVPAARPPVPVSPAAPSPAALAGIAASPIPAPLPVPAAPVPASSTPIPASSPSAATPASPPAPSTPRASAVPTAPGASAPASPAAASSSTSTGSVPGTSVGGGTVTATPDSVSLPAGTALPAGAAAPSSAGESPASPSDSSGAPAAAGVAAKDSAGSESTPLPDAPPAPVSPPPVTEPSMLAGRTVGAVDQPIPGLVLPVVTPPPAQPASEGESASTGSAIGSLSATQLPGVEASTGSVDAVATSTDAPDAQPQVDMSGAPASEPVHVSPEPVGSSANMTTTGDEPAKGTSTTPEHGGSSVEMAMTGHEVARGPSVDPADRGNGAGQARHILGALGFRTPVHRPGKQNDRGGDFAQSDRPSAMPYTASGMRQVRAGERNDVRPGADAARRAGAAAGAGAVIDAGAGSGRRRFTALLALLLIFVGAFALILGALRRARRPVAPHAVGAEAALDPGTSASRVEEDACFSPDPVLRVSPEPFNLGALLRDIDRGGGYRDCRTPRRPRRAAERNDRRASERRRRVHARL